MSKKNQTVIDIKNKTNEELAILAFQLKTQLVEFRFKKNTGEFKKTHIVSETRKMIAQILTVLKSRDVDISISSCGLMMYDRKNNKVVPLSKQAQEVINAQRSAVANETANVKTQSESEAKFGTPIDLNQESTVKNSQVNQKNVEKTIRKTQGGGK
ncbi:MAG: 50S ribosomal protein L29 [Mycoplasmataceae bacterium]|jgi:ribosomal protein L29|nr:50S ribosomal protein L29 [Mycoplasmataceae bacterium]